MTLARALMALLAVLLVGRSAAAAETQCALLAEPPPPLPVFCHPTIPRYPQQALAQRLDGDVVVEIQVSVHGGYPRSSRVVSSDPPEIFDEAALTAVRNSCWGKHEVSGKPACYRVQRTIRFRYPK